ncbi:16S rRNA (cytidine(1402)-2'-O)-methyltransferase [candidate division KSB1 bacterium]
MDAAADIGFRQDNPDTGRLFVVATPIGNLGDITFRAIEVLQNVHIIAAEDTRHTGVLAKRYNISTKRISFYDHNAKKRLPDLLNRMKTGQDVALVSDAGTPGISDPGYILIRNCIDNNIPVISIPGPTALITALVISGMPTERFVFEGFLPVKKGRKTRLELLAEEPRTIVFYESPHRINRTLGDLLQYFGDRDIAIIREVTKLYEEVVRLRISEAVERFRQRKPKGEFVLVVRGK